MYYDGEIHGNFVGLTKRSGKELNERNFDREEQKIFDEAKRVEIQNLEGGGAIRIIEDRGEADRLRKEFPDRVMPSRFILTRKQQEIGERWKAKARWILLGHRDPDALELERFAPTPATPAVYLTFQVISSLCFELYIMDVTSAFGQSDPEQRRQGRLFASLPKTGLPGRPAWSLIEVLTAAYGLVNAPATWRRTVRKYPLSLGYQESVFDPCLFYLPYNEKELEELGGVGKARGCAGVVLLDVDDFVQGGGIRHAELMGQLRERFKFGKWRKIYGGSGEYLGRTVHQLPNFEVRVDMRRYVEEKLSPIHLTRHRLKDGDDAKLSEKEITALRGASGSLLWIAKEARPDVAAASTMTMSWGSDGPTIKDVKAANKVISELKRTPDYYLRILPVSLNTGLWVLISDASVANDHVKSQGGFLVGFADGEILQGDLVNFSINSWRSHRLRRVVKASLGSEALAMDDGLAELEWVKAMYAELVIPGSTISDGSRYGPDQTIAVVRQVDPSEESILVTDARALYDLFHRRSGAAGLCRRAQIDVSVLAESARVLKATVHWLPGNFMVSDCLTKRLGNSALMRKVMLHGKYAIKACGLEKLAQLADCISDPKSPPDGCETVSNKLGSDRSVQSVVHAVQCDVP